ncbi:MAG: hypothetical protein HQL03_05440 [Nitrospirae bacterium]|nr:hypothetical protein [Nitrospirota bacterium]MBF0592072.1 hypothetical protein [Nitrospirota bacterium]
MCIFPGYRGISLALFCVLLFAHGLSPDAFSAQDTPQGTSKGGASKSGVSGSDAQNVKRPEVKGNETAPPKAEPKVSQAELIRKEIELKRREERLQALKADVDRRIDKYEKLLSQIEEALNKVKDADVERMKKLVKAYEAMEPEEASAQLTELDEDLAVTILLKMNSRKAGAALGLIEPQKAAALSKKMSKTVNNFPGN